MQDKPYWLTVLVGSALVMLAAAGGLLYFFKPESEARVEVKTAFDASGHAYTSMMAGEVHHCLAFAKPANPADWGKPDRDFSRLATTYYHRRSPVGIVLQRLDWFGQVTTQKSSHNEFRSDARL